MNLNGFKTQSLSNGHVDNDTTGEEKEDVDDFKVNAQSEFYKNQERKSCFG